MFPYTTQYATNEWPGKDLWLCAYDLVRRERVVLGNGSPTTLDVPHAVLASCAIPGMYRPVRDDRRVLVDGGVTSTTNLDLVVPRPRGLVIVVAPMAYETSESHRPADQLTRRRAARALAHEMRLARDAGNEIKPSLDIKWRPRGGTGRRCGNALTGCGR